MNFDTLCSIILEGKNLMKTRVAVVNPNPVISMEDVLKNPLDPGAGVRTYIDDNIEGNDDPERVARRALRRINWVVKTMVKRMGTRSTDIHKLLINIIVVLEKYLTNVMRYSEEQIEAEQLKISKEAAFIGKLMLLPNSRMPNAKGVFGPSDEDIIDEPKKKEGREPIADRLQREFGMSVDEYLAAFDPDLIETIKKIVKEGPKKTSMPEAEETFGVEPEETIAEEGVETDDISGVSAIDIMKDPRIKGIYDPRIVRKIMKSMIEMGSLILTPDNKVIVPEEGTEEWRGSLERARDTAKMRNMKPEDLPTKNEEEELVQGHEDGGEDVAVAQSGKVTPEDESEEETDEHLGDIAAQRLGYKASKHGAAEEDAPEDDDSWQ